MKKSLFSVLMVLITTISTQDLRAQIYKGLPPNAKTYITKHFYGYNICHYEKDQEILDIEHKIYINNNSGSTFKLKFDKAGQIKVITSKDDELSFPTSVLPIKILQYLKRNYHNSNIIEWEKKKNSQHIELDNGIELIFNSNGDFLRIDD